jgi:hypothetical protein
VGVEGSYSKNISLDLHVQKRKSVVEKYYCDIFADLFCDFFSNFYFVVNRNAHFQFRKSINNQPHLYYLVSNGKFVKDIVLEK